MSVEMSNEEDKMLSLGPFLGSTVSHECYFEQCTVFYNVYKFYRKKLCRNIYQRYLGYSKEMNKITIHNYLHMPHVAIGRSCLRSQ